MVCHVVSHVLATVTDGPGVVDRFMLRVHGLSEYLLKYVTQCIASSPHDTDACPDTDPLSSSFVHSSGRMNCYHDIS